MKNNIEQFRNITLPPVRRIYPSLISNQIVPVQPIIHTPEIQQYYAQFVSYKGEQKQTLKDEYLNRDI